MPSIESLREMVGGIEPVLNGQHVASLGRPGFQQNVDRTVPPGTPHVAQGIDDLAPETAIG